MSFRSATHIEALEPRNLLSASGFAATGIFESNQRYGIKPSVGLSIPLAPSISGSTLPATLVAGVAAHGVVNISLTNEGNATTPSPLKLMFFAIAGSSDIPGIELKQIVRNVNLKPGARYTTSVLLNVGSHILPVGDYSLAFEAYTPDVNEVSASSIEQASSAIFSVVPANIALSETVEKSTLPTSSIGGVISRESVTFTITNDGNVTTPGKTTVSLFATTAGIVDATAIPVASLTKVLRIKPGKSLRVTVPVKRIPALTPGAYTIVAQITDPVQQITSTTVGELTVIS